jgi:hypothetical protein
VALFASLNGHPLQQGTLSIPFYGAWVADVNVASGGENLSGRVTLVLAGLTLQGYIFRGGDFTGSTVYRVVGGAGWQITVTPHPYISKFGLKLSIILKDVASKIGETVNVPALSDRTVGTFYLRQRAPASQVLRQLAPQWWIDPAGVTQIGTRSSPVITSGFAVLPGTNLGLGKVVLGTDQVQDWVPGSLFSSSTLSQRRVSGVLHKWGSNQLRTTVWTTP